VLKVWLSAFSERNLAYRQARGLSLVPQPPAVLIQRMVDADCAGVAFSAEPVTGRRSVAVVNAVPGLGDALVSGAVDSDMFYIDREGTVLSESRAEVSSGLSREQAAQIAALVRKAEAHFMVPQDMEWAIAGEKIFVLQARPITKLGSAAAPIIWDNSNIGESYQGVTTPLTFSFARKAYEHVYIQFCRMMGVSESRIKANAHVFPHMIGFVNGRIYYNLLNWYRLISILPGYKTNRLFMEQMMGVSQTLPPDLVAEIAAENQTEGVSDRITFLFSVLKSAAHLANLQMEIDSFNQRFEAALALVPDDLNGQSLEQLSKLYRGLEQSLLPHWDAPLTNDWFAMIFYGLLKQLCTKWCGDSDSTMQNALLCNMSGIISAVPAQRMRDMAATASADAVLLSALDSDDLEKILAAISKNSDFEKQYRSY
ncbi:MAG: PEP/pyruvate-binding domain-containing protein, partial [Terriglobales bacterium]